MQLYLKGAYTYDFVGAKFGVTGVTIYHHVKKYRESHEVAR